MSQTTTDSGLSTQQVLQIANLAKLAVSETQAASYASELNQILHLMDTLADIDTISVAPLASPHEVSQPLRNDVVSETNQCEANQAMAPAVENGLYLVPKVIE